jgi:hypothetical protein
MKQPRRQHIDGIQTRFDQRRPTFEEDGLVFYNRYWPPTHPAEGGETETFKRYFAQMLEAIITRCIAGSGCEAKRRESHRARWLSVCVCYVFGVDVTVRGD